VTVEDYKTRGTKNGLALWTGVLAGPTAWLIQFQTRYSLVEWICSSRQTWASHLVWIGFLLLSLGGGLLSWRNWVRAGREWPSDLVSAPRGTESLLSVLGMMTSAMFSLVIIAQAIPTFMINPCQE